MAHLILTVTDIQVETPIIRSLVLEAANGQALPAFTAGAHVKVTIPGQAVPRCYSLVCLDADQTSFDAPERYRIGVRLEEPGTGGSRHMHGLKIGDTLQVEGPKNDFPLHDMATGESRTVLIAGGIGITPIISMTTALHHAQRPYELHYYGRSRDQMGFLEALTARHGDALQIHADDDATTQLALRDLLQKMEPSQHLYVCGPKGLIDAVIEQSRNLQWPPSQVHFEVFTSAAAMTGDKAFDVELRQSGRTLHIPADKTILDVLEEAGCDPMYDCRRGECGVCQATVLEGIPDHRDHYLSDSERKAGEVMQICVSRSHSDRLVLDL
ncbi:oxidoreductase [Pollutimonas subterranea]|uniref:Oxidoreductase n=1 Tax=Pollutimonas subterranea TaxID=2045210 RepID=A0A2N4U1N8_9BURK|nr:PDR/VanB family oxidoreductase [Pollutimonas subterranea]PLC48933.1 oxidoreductase [Pollutimonas subterranea]